jgi:chloride channel protein, CIC family
VAFGEIAGHLLGLAAGPPALYAVVAMGAVFASAARAPLTSVASVVEMTGDYTLTLPVMLAVAIATAASRALSYGTIYTTKLLRRGYDIDRATPWRAFGDLTAADAMRPFSAPLTVPGGPGDHTGGPGGDGDAAAPTPVPLPGPVTYHGDPQAVLADESLALALRQLAASGRDGLPVLSADRRQMQGWIPISIWRHRRLQDPGLTLAPGDRISLLTPAAWQPQPGLGGAGVDANGMLVPAASSARAENGPAKPHRGGVDR